MPNYRRAAIEGGTYFFTVTTLRRQPFLVAPEVRTALREAINTVRLTLPFTINAWVLLPDHLHCIWTLPPGDADFATRWRLLKTKVTQRCGENFGCDAYLTARRRKKGQGSLWQNRYWEHQIRDEQDFARHADYTHWNPVKHGQVKYVSDWPYSSFHRYVREGIYPSDWATGTNGDAGGFGECG
jgi:putative transposase